LGNLLAAIWAAVCLLYWAACAYISGWRVFLKNLMSNIAVNNAPFDRCDGAKAHRSFLRFMPPLALLIVSVRFFGLPRPGKPESASDS